jgi:hypothetical protein
MAEPTSAALGCMYFDVATVELDENGVPVFSGSARKIPGPNVVAGILSAWCAAYSPSGS